MDSSVGDVAAWTIVKGVRVDGELVRYVPIGGGRTRRERRVDGCYVDDDIKPFKAISPELRKVLRRMFPPTEERETVEDYWRPIEGTRLQDDGDIYRAEHAISPRGIACDEDDVQSYDPARQGVMPSEAFYGGRGELIGWMDAADNSEPGEDE